MNRKTILTLLLVGLFPSQVLRADDAPSFSRDIRPILAAKCLACHGPDKEKREADLRLDVRKVAVESGAIVPGKPKQSELISRILSQDPDSQMPPPDADPS